MTKKTEQKAAAPSPIDPVSLSGQLILDKEFNADNITPLIRTIKFLNLLPKEKQPKRIMIEINSPGGAIMNLSHLLYTMETSKIPVDTMGVGLSASCGCLLLMAGKKRYALREAQIMSHTYSAGSAGKEGELYSRVKSFKMVSKHMIDWYKKYTGKSEKYIRQHLLKPNDVWLTASEAKKHGLIDKVI